MTSPHCAQLKYLPVLAVEIKYCTILYRAASPTVSLAEECGWLGKWLLLLSLFRSVRFESVLREKLFAETKMM